MLFCLYGTWIVPHSCEAYSRPVNSPEVDVQVPPIHTLIGSTITSLAILTIKVDTIRVFLHHPIP